MPPRQRLGLNNSRSAGFASAIRSSLYDLLIAIRPCHQTTNYQHQLEYIPPDKDAANASPDLPFSIENAKFRVYEGWGEIQFDQKHKHVTAVREVFHARGSVSTSMVGVASTVEIDEKQIFMISVTNYRMLKADKAQGTIASGPSNK